MKKLLRYLTAVLFVLMAGIFFGRVPVMATTPLDPITVADPKITLVSNPSAGGRITIFGRSGSSFPRGTELTLQISSNPRYTFDKLVVNGEEVTTSAGVMTINSRSYTFTLLKDTTAEAFFQSESGGNECTVTLGSNPSEGGQIVIFNNTGNVQTFAPSYRANRGDFLYGPAGISWHGVRRQLYGVYGQWEENSRGV